MRYKLCVTRAPNNDADVRIAYDCDVHAFIRSSLNLVCANREGTPLLTATAAHDSTACRLLLDCGADVNFATDESRPLIEAIKCQDLDLVRLFLDSGANVELATDLEGSPLAVAAATWRTSLDVVNLLLDRGANVNSLSGIRGSPLGAAAFSNDTEVVNLLLAHGADLNETAGSLCSIALRQAIMGLKGKRTKKDTVLSLLLSDHRSRVSTQDALHLLLFASKALVATAIPALIRHGADPNGKDEEGLIALHAAVARDSKDQYVQARPIRTIEALLEHGADVDTKSGQHETVLILASADGNLDLVKVLLRHKANKRHRSKAFGTALEAARAGRHESVIRLLSQAGARDMSSDIHSPHEERPRRRILKSKRYI